MRLINLIPKWKLNEMQWNEMTKVNEYKYWIHPMEIQTQSNAMQRNVM